MPAPKSRKTEMPDLFDKDKKPNPDGREIRCFRFELRKADDGKKTLVGHAAVFNEPTEIDNWWFSFREQIAPGAFKATIKEDDIRALFNHNPDYILGRNTAGTLELSEDEKGLKTIIQPPDTQAARDVITSIERGDISQMSFAFQVLEEEWAYGEEKEPDLRTIKKVRLFDVSPVTFPAYEGTDIALRSHDAWAKEQGRTKPPEEPAGDEVSASLFLRRKLEIGRT